MVKIRVKQLSTNGHETKLMEPEELVQTLRQGHIAFDEKTHNHITINQVYNIKVDVTVMVVPIVVGG